MTFSVLTLDAALRHVFEDAARDLARETGYCLRERKLTGPVLAKTLALGLLRDPGASLDRLAEFAEARLGVAFTPQALDARLGEPAACFLEALFHEALSLALAARPALLPVLRRFAGVYLRDATLIPLPAALARLLPARPKTGTGPAAALKLVVEAELTSGLLTAADALPGAANEKLAALCGGPLPAGALVLEDMGFLSGGRLQDYADRGVYFLTRVPAWAAFFGEDGSRIDLPGLLASGGWHIDRDVRLFHAERLPVRLLAARLPEEEAARRRERARKEARERGRRVSPARLALCEWNVLVTNAPAGLLSAAEGSDVRRVRWQLELAFKGLKSGGGRIDRSRTRKPWRALCEVYAKLLGAVVRSWALLAAGFVPLAHSGLKAARRARAVAGRLARAAGRLRRLGRVIARLAVLLHRRCRVQRRRKAPSTLDRLAAHDREADPDNAPPP